MRDAENSLLFQNLFANCFCDIRDDIRKMSLGDNCEEGTPGNIPNPEVKLFSADGTWWAAAWESRSLPRDFSF